jgi:hypothetical protein
MFKTIKWVSIVFTLVILVAVASTEFGIIKANAESKELEYTVCPNDTVWTIVADNCNPNDDIRLFVFLTEKRNNIQGKHIRAGQRLVLVLPKH